MTVYDLLRLHPMMTCLCGRAGMDRDIKYIDIVEVPEGASWVVPGDFIITTGFFFRTDADFVWRRANHVKNKSQVMSIIFMHINKQNPR